MLVRFIMSWRMFKPGDLREIPDGTANALIDRGIAEESENEPVEFATASPPEAAVSVRQRARPRRSK